LRERWNDLVRRTKLASSTVQGILAGDVMCITDDETSSSRETAARSVRDSVAGGARRAEKAAPEGTETIRLSREIMSLESWKSFFEIGGVVLLLLTFVFGAGALIATRRVNEIQAGQLREFDKELTAAQGANLILSKQIEESDW
jgi:hypothetical protein